MTHNTINLRLLIKISLVVVIILSLSENSYSAMASPYMTWDNCPPGSRELTSWNVKEDTNGDGIYDTETTKNCNGHIDRHPISGYDWGFRVLTVPEYINAADPEFEYNSNNNWTVSQFDIFDDLLYTIVHTSSPDSTFIIVNTYQGTSTQVPYLQLEHPDILKDINVSPNPSECLVTIRFSSAASYNVFVELYDIKGKKICDMEKLCEKDSENSLIFDVSLYPSGYYILKFSSNGLIYTTQLVISR